MKEKQILLEPGKQDAGRRGGRPRLPAAQSGHRQALVYLGPGYDQE